MTKQKIASDSVAVLGAGSWGTALSTVLARNGHSVRLWDVNKEALQELSTTGYSRYLPNIEIPSGIVGCSELTEALEGAHYCVIVVPSHAFETVLHQLKPNVSSNTRLICATKGLAPKTGQFLSEITKAVLPKALYAILSGPSFAREVAEGLPTAVTIASESPAFATEVANYFRNDSFSCYTTQDVIGVQFGAVVKNVLAVAVGISDGLGLGANTRAALITRGLAEMVHLGEALGAKRDTLMGLAGCGDVILTCTDNQSRNRRFGLALAEGLSEAEALNKIGQVVEAVYNVEQLCRLAQEREISLPISEQVFKIIKHGVAPRKALETVFSNEPQSEFA